MIFKSIFVHSKFPENLQRLYELASNLWSVWDYDAIGLFYRIDTPLFREANHNPLKLLHNLSREKLNNLSNDKGFLFEFEKVWEKFQDYLKSPSIFKSRYADECDFKKDDVIAYFSMEFGLHESIPIYAGGLGILTGDVLKGASDLDLPVVGIGLLYKFGYFTQYLGPDAYQHELSAEFENHLIPIRELRDSRGNWAHVTVNIMDNNVNVKLWKMLIGKSELILLDTDIEDNPPHLRDITYELYATDREKRIQQELVLGIGGVKALKLLGKSAKIYHFNDGHSAFAIIGRLQDLTQDKNFSFSEAKAIIRASTVFTTHTPVIAGNENFSTDLVKKYLRPAVTDMGLNFDDVAKLGYVDEKTNVFWLTAFAMRFSRYINGVSKQHAQTSKKIWSQIFPQTPTVEIPIIAIKNGVHMSWISPPITDLFNRYLGPDYIYCEKKDGIWQKIYDIPDDELWEEHRRNKKDLINFVRRPTPERKIARGYSHAKTHPFAQSLNIEHLTIVFARRFAGYKRPLLILKDKDRFKEILTNSKKPVQMIFAGKAHPADQQCKNMIKEILDFAREYQVEEKVIFLENYDINIARHLCWGADLWLNNPAPYMEASGTSGVKAAMNGVLHLSTLEGWWPEGYNHKNGWAITAGTRFNTTELQNAADANQLYELLENEITESYYDRNEAYTPQTWVKMMKESIFSVCRNFNMNRMLCDYIKYRYLPSKKYAENISADNYKLLKHAIQQEKIVLEYWEQIKIISFALGKKETLTEADIVEVKCSVRFGPASPELFIAELFYMFDRDRTYKILPMQLTQEHEDLFNYTYPLELEGFGPQSLNVRIKPANQIIQDIHPELVKWMD